MLCANALEDRQWLAGVVGKVHRSQTPDELCFALTSALSPVEETLFCANAPDSQTAGTPCFALTPSVTGIRSEHVLR